MIDNQIIDALLNLKNENNIYISNVNKLYYDIYKIENLFEMSSEIKFIINNIYVGNLHNGFLFLINNIKDLIFNLGKINYDILIKYMKYNFNYIYNEILLNAYNIIFNIIDIKSIKNENMINLQINLIASYEENTDDNIQNIINKNIVFNNLYNII
jgi:hypothetical protein